MSLRWGYIVKGFGGTELKTNTTGQNEPVAETKQRNIRVPDDLWKLATEKAKRRHETITAVLIRALWAYVEEDK